MIKFPMDRSIELVKIADLIECMTCSQFVEVESSFYKKKKKTKLKRAIRGNFVKMFGSSCCAYKFKYFLEIENRLRTTMCTMVMEIKSIFLFRRR